MITLNNLLWESKDDEANKIIIKPLYSPPVTINSCCGKPTPGCGGEPPIHVINGN